MKTLIKIITAGAVIFFIGLLTQISAQAKTRHPALITSAYYITAKNRSTVTHGVMYRDFGLNVKGSLKM